MYIQNNEEKKAIHQNSCQKWYQHEIVLRSRQKLSLNSASSVYKYFIETHSYAMLACKMMKKFVSFAND